MPYLTPVVTKGSCYRRFVIGQVIAGRYEIIRQLGAGGMGAVYQARQLSMDRMVALKLIHPHIVSEEVARRFHREMKATSKIEHPNTIAVFDFGADDSSGQLFLAMEYLEGRPLSKLLEEAGALPLPRIVHIASQVVRALGAAHAEGIAHRDLKPDNVMLVDRYGEHDVVKVLDFGIARFVDGDAEPDEDDARRSGRGDAGVHVARAGDGAAGRSPRRLLLARRDAVPDGARAAAVRRADAGGAAGGARDGEAAGAVGGGARRDVAGVRGADR